MMINSDRRDYTIKRINDHKTKTYFKEVYLQKNFEDRILNEKQEDIHTYAADKLNFLEMKKEFRKIASEMIVRQNKLEIQYPHVKVNDDQIMLIFDDNKELLGSNYNKEEDLKEMMRKKYIFRNIKPFA